MAPPGPTISSLAVVQVCKNYVDKLFVDLDCLLKIGEEGEVVEMSRLRSAQACSFKGF